VRSKSCCFPLKKFNCCHILVFDIRQLKFPFGFPSFLDEYISNDTEKSKKFASNSVLVANELKKHEVFSKNSFGIHIFSQFRKFLLPDLQIIHQVCPYIMFNKAKYENSQILTISLTGYNNQSQITTCSTQINQIDSQPQSLHGKYFFYIYGCERNSPSIYIMYPSIRP
jgi:hypothetical protein